MFEYDFANYKNNKPNSLLIHFGLYIIFRPFLKRYRRMFYYQQCREIMYMPKLSHIITAPFILTASLLSAHAFSITFQGKPDFPVDSAEFGHTLAKHGKYIIVGADRHAEFGRSNQTTLNWDNNRNYDGGAIYLLTDDNSEPIKKYQFLKNPTLQPNSDHIFHLASPLNFSSQVDITDNWIIATLTRHYNPVNFTSQPAVVIIPKTNGQFPTCPTSAYVTGIPADSTTQRNWGNAVNCTPISGTSTSSNILIVPLPPEFYGKLGRYAKVKISGDTFAVAVSDRLVTYHRNATSGQWQLIQTFVPDAGQIISDIDLHGQHLVIGVNSAQGPIAYHDNSDGVFDNNDYIFDYSGKVYTFELSQTAATSAGVLSGGGLGFGLQVALNQNTLVVGSGGIAYPAQYITLNPHLAYTPLPIGKVHQYKFDTQAASGQNAWLNRGYGEFTSTPRQLSLDENVLAVQLHEAGQNVSSQYVTYEPNVLVKLFYKVPGADPAFNLGTGSQDKSIYKSQIEAARPYYSQNEYGSMDPIRVGNGSVVIGWRAARGDISNLFPLTGGIFQVNLTEL